MMNTQEVETLFSQNMMEINKMNIASGSMIKALVQALESNGLVYIELSDAVPDGHKVHYQHKEGDKTQLVQIASALGLKITDTTLEAHYD
ncbi:hypothetical protein ACU6U9_12430 [Pseudomonas sp. HK3]|jgi:hypothetical protein